MFVSFYTPGTLHDRESRWFCVKKRGGGDHLYLELINSKYLTGSHFNEPWIDEKKGPLYAPLSPHCTKNIFKLHAGADNSLILCNWMLTRVNM